jgi:hypothetical protein
MALASKCFIGNCEEWCAGLGLGPLAYRFFLQVLILATGFKYQDYFDPMKIVGKDSMELVSTWKQGRPSSYLGILSSTAPNHFILLGPNTVQFYL